MKPIIEITNLGKKYPILHEKKVYGTLRDTIVNRIKHPFAKTKTHETFWALKDINLSINKGDVVGIIGRNGAGKSTLLKILSGITRPTEGKVKLYGRVSSLLEVGTGFHPELTGRENIYLNGVILGMTRKEVSKKFDQIVAFAGVEKFLDTPVKHYSSGMYVRLAFAIAAHLEPDILIVDEVLAVGDMEFQKKCLGKMEEVSKEEGRTVLFVSHNMQAISSLTKKCIYLVDGTMNSFADTNSVVSKYIQYPLSETTFYEDFIYQTNPKIISIRVQTSLSNGIHECGKNLKFSFKLYTPRPLKGAALSFQIINSLGIPVTHILTLDSEIPMCRSKGIHEMVCDIKKAHLYPDNYNITVYFAEKSSESHFQTVENVCAFKVAKIDEMREYYWYPHSAIYIEDHEWTKNKS